MDKTQLFCLIIFFQFSKEVLQNGQNVPKNCQYLNKFGSCPFVCPSVCLLRFSNDHGSAKWSQNFTKPSAYGNVGLPNSLKMLWPAQVTMCTHNTWNVHPIFVTFFYFFVSFLKFWRLSSLKIKKRTLHLKKIWTRRNFFVWFIFSNSVWKSLKMAKVCPNGLNFPFFWPLVAKIWHLGIKVRK